MSEATGTAVDARETERVARQIEQFKRKCGDHGEEALNFAYHAALPVALNPEFLHLLRINFFVDIDCPLPYEVEYEFLLSSLCRQIDEGLYEVERDVRLVLLEGLAREFGQERMREVAMLLWEYVEQQEPCSEHLGLERAQQLTSLSFLEITKAKKWLHQAQAEVENYSLEASRDWLVAMQSDVEETTEIKIRFNDLTLEGKPFQCPPLPSHYIGRPGIQEAIKNKLIDTQPSTADRLVISAVKGLGGIGKSVMASAVALDRDVQRTFSDGVLWATLGQKPDSLSHLHNWIRALGDYGKSFTSTESASIYLRTLLLEKKMLLILDDVWALEHLIPFDVGGPNCRILVTSREANIPDAECFNMDVMTSEQALALLLGKEQDYQLSETDRLAAEALVKALGYHPLALKLTKAQVAQGVDWRESLDRFKKQQVIRQRDSSLSTDLPNTDFNQTNHSGTNFQTQVTGGQVNQAQTINIYNTPQSPNPTSQPLSSPADTLAQQYLDIVLKILIQNGATQITPSSPTIDLIAQITDFEPGLGMRGDAFFLFSTFDSITPAGLRTYSANCLNISQSYPASSPSRAIFNFRIPTRCCFSIAIVLQLDSASETAIRNKNPFQDAVDTLWYEIPIIFDLSQQKLVYYQEASNFLENFRGEIVWKKLRETIQQLLDGQP